MRKLNWLGLLLLSILALQAPALAQKPVKSMVNSKESKSTLGQKSAVSTAKKQKMAQIKHSVMAQNQAAIPAWHDIKNLPSLSVQQQTKLSTLYKPYKQKLRALKEELQIALKEESNGTRSNSIPKKNNKNQNITVGEAILLGSLEPEESSNSSANGSTEQASNDEAKSLFERMIATKKDAWNHLQTLLTRAQIEEVTAAATARVKSKAARKAQPEQKAEPVSID